MALDLSTPLTRELDDLERAFRRLAAELVKEALARHRPRREIVMEHGFLDDRVLARLLRPEALTGPQPIDRVLRRRIQARTVDARSRRARQR